MYDADALKHAQAFARAAAARVDTGSSQDMLEEARRRLSSSRTLLSQAEPLRAHDLPPWRLPLRSHPARSGSR